MLTQEQFDRWREVQVARCFGEDMFLGLPDRWYEDGPHWGCRNGHVSHRYLKTERGDKCLACGDWVSLIDPRIETDEQLQAELEEWTNANVN